VNARQWISIYAERLGTEAPNADEWSALLDLVGEAAHASERVAAPVACWVAAKAGGSLEDALATARKVAAADGSDSAPGAAGAEGRHPDAGN
jgi:hypothetical protein